MSGRRQRITGQTYAERLLAPPVSFSNGPSWVHESPYMYKDFEEKTPVGVSRLKELAMKRVLSDQRSLTPELFTNVPWDIAHEMWLCLGKRYSPSIIRDWTWFWLFLLDNPAESRPCICGNCSRRPIGTNSEIFHSIDQ